MKRILSVLLALLLIVGASALALEGSGYPAYDEAAFSENRFGGNFSGDNLLLEFDSSPDYSNLQSESIQACFFAFSEDKNHYIELYIELPDDIASGDHLSSENAIAKLDSVISIAFYEISASSETLYYAGSLSGILYPNGCAFDIVIDEAHVSDSAVELSGKLSAVLCRFDGNTPTAETLTLDNARFHFELPLNADSDVRKDAPTEKPSYAAPAFTLPPDYIIL